MDQSQERTLAVLDALYGDGAWEISKAMTDRQKRMTTAGLSAVGAAAGAAGLGYAAVKTGGAYKTARMGRKAMRVKGVYRTGRKAAAIEAVKKEPFGSALVPLEVAGLGGEIMATKILHGDTKKHSKVAKAESASPTNAKLKIVKAGVNGAGKGVKAAPALKAKIAAAASEVPETNQIPVKIFNRKVVKKSVEFAVTGEVCKMNTDLKQVFGWASVIEVNGEPVIDLQGDVMTIDTIEKAAYSYVHGSRKGGRQHEREGEEPLHVSDMIESFVLTPEKKQQMGLGDSVPTGWWVGFQINDEDTWQQYKDGKLKEFSIHGSGTRKALEL